MYIIRRTSSNISRPSSRVSSVKSSVSLLTSRLAMAALSPAAPKGSSRWSIPFSYCSSWSSDARRRVHRHLPNRGSNSAQALCHSKMHICPRRVARRVCSGTNRLAPSTTHTPTQASNGRRTRPQRLSRKVLSCDVGGCREYFYGPSSPILLSRNILFPS